MNSHLCIPKLQLSRYNRMNPEHQRTKSFSKGETDTATLTTYSQLGTNPFWKVLHYSHGNVVIIIVFKQRLLGFQILTLACISCDSGNVIVSYSLHLSLLSFLFLM